MKFSLESDLEFEADSTDEALLKLANHFLAQMETRPLFYIGDNQGFDALNAMIENTPTLSGPSTEGYIDVDIHGDFEAPEGLQ